MDVTAFATVMNLVKWKSRYLLNNCHLYQIGGAQVLCLAGCLSTSVLSRLHSSCPWPVCKSGMIKEKKAWWLLCGYK